MRGKVAALQETIEYAFDGEKKEKAPTSTPRFRTEIHCRAYPFMTITYSQTQVTRGREAVHERLVKLIKEFGTICGEVIRQKDEAALVEFLSFLNALNEAVKTAERDVEEALRDLRQRTVH
jgi:hypothetical protein